MRDWAWFVRRSSRALALGLGLALFAACDDSSEETRPLDFGYFVHPGALDAGSPGEVRAGVYVGGSSCWHLGGSSVARQGNRLILSGYAVREAGPSICPLRREYAVLDFTIPALEAGRYVIEAGDLADTLEVASPAPRPAGKFFASQPATASPRICRRKITANGTAKRLLDSSWTLAASRFIGSHW